VPLQTSGPLKFSEIQTEFGGADPIALSEYYAGGANVPSSTSGTNGAVPTSGAISVSKFYGTSDISVTASNVSGSAGGFAASGNVSTSGSSPNTTVTGGTAPYTYSWAHISTSSGPTPGISGSSIANPTWSAFVDDSTNSVSTWRVTVTSSGGGSSAQVNITVTLIWTNFE
jgi:hypothetical protein